jgi:hypothetical protein
MERSETRIITSRSNLCDLHIKQSEWLDQMRALFSSLVLQRMDETSNDMSSLQRHKKYKHEDYMRLL